LENKLFTLDKEITMHRLRVSGGVVMGTRKPGRPIGTGKVDEPLLRQVAELLLSDSELKPTTAMKRLVGPDKASDIRRLQVKWKTEGAKVLAEAQQRRRAAEAQASRQTGTLRDISSLADRLASSPAMKLAREMENSPSMKLAREMQNSPAMRLVREMQNSPAMKLAREMQNSPAMRLVREMQNSPAMEFARGMENSPAMKLAQELQNSPIMKMVREFQEWPLMKPLGS
jgi:hypothetical protein